MSPRPHKTIRRSSVRIRHDLRLAPDTAELIQRIGAKLHLEKIRVRVRGKNGSKTTLQHSANDVIERCIHYTAQNLGVKV